MDFLKSVGYFFAAVLIFYTAQVFIDDIKTGKKTLRNYMIAFFLAIIGLWLFYEAAIHLYWDYQNSPVFK